MKLFIAEAILNAFLNEEDAITLSVPVENDFLCTSSRHFDLMRGKMNVE
tara:strand:- start:1806 stop:1952 length:147 start_codon:yes stop_codon:yes gene_type:complete